jgi:hypothetical protein
VKYRFKAYAERFASEARREAGLDEGAPLCPWAYAERRGVIVLAPADLGIGPDDIAQLTVIDPDSWSGVTIREGAQLAVILNSAHPKTRQANTLMHELSHLELKHVPNGVTISEQGLLLLSDFSADQEEEADWLAGSLLLPRNALMRHRARGASANEIADIFGISDELCTWRLRMTGVDRQLGVGRRSPFR